MCDIHGKKEDQFCLHHEEYCCRKCKTTRHEVAPCECLPVREVYYRLQLEMEEAIQDLVRLRDRGKRIMDGSYQRNLLYRVNDEEIHLDKFYKDMKKKFRETKAKIQAFTADDLSDESRHQLHQFMARSVPEKIRKRDQPLEMVLQMKNVKKQIKQANSLLYSLPNYIEVTIDSKFMNLIAYNGDPVVIRGRPKYIPPVDSDDDDTTNELDELAYELPDTERTMNGTFTFTSSGRKAKQATFDVLSPVQTGAIQWTNNAPAFPSSRKSARPAETAAKPPRPANKYEKQIQEVKDRLNLPPISLTPQPVKNRRATRVGAKSLPDKTKMDNDDPSGPVRKVFLKNKSTNRFVVRERFQLDGCEDAIVLQNCIVLSLGDRIQKRDKKNMKLVVGIRLTNTANMCAITGNPTQIAVIQRDKCITVLDTISGLSVVYKIKITQPYTEVCHIATTDTGPYHPSYIFAAIYKGYPNRPTSCIDVIEAKTTRKPGRPPLFDISAVEVNLANQGYEAKEIFGISGLNNDGHIVLGTGEGLLCINQAGRLVWKTPTRREVSGLLCTKNLLYACMQDERKVMSFNKAGFLTDDNIIADLDIIPCRLSAHWDILLVKDFKTKAWVSIVFKHGLFIV